jgi:putative DNA primase/helicase
VPIARDSAGWELVVTPIASITRRAVQWLWPGRLAIGKLALLEGDPSVGKSWLTLAIATAIAHGAPFPIDSERRQPGKVLVMTAEDGLADTVAPRLDAMGADTARIDAIESAARPYYAHPDPDFAARMGEEGRALELERRAIMLTEDLSKLDRILSSGLYSLLTIDPLNAYIPASIDSAKDNAVRSVLAPLASMAERYGVAVLAVRHLTKGSRDKAIYRGQGSIGYTAAARIVLLAGQEVNNGGRRLLMPIKCNLAPLADPITYTIDAGRFGWGVAVPGVKPEAVLAPEPEEDRKTGTQEAGDLLVDFLSEGDQPASETMRHIRQKLGVSVMTVQRARQERGIRTQRRGFGRQAEVYWHLPKSFQPTLIEGAVGKDDSTNGETSHENHKSQPPIDTIPTIKGGDDIYGNAELGTLHPGTKGMVSMEPEAQPHIGRSDLEDLADSLAQEGPPDDLAQFDGDDTPL